MKICFATNNLHKLNEVQDLLGEEFRLITLQEIGCYEELPEERNTLEGNSFQKADYVFKKYHTPCFADDSGLEVDALNGAPGVSSAHYAGPQRSPEDNIDLLLSNMTGMTNRNAHFRAVITFVSAHQAHPFEGIVKGKILTTKKGTGGFGYDPVFLPEGFQKTFAEMNTGEKNKLSHRAIAVNKLISFLKTSNKNNP